MRALILTLSFIVVGLAVAIVIEISSRSNTVHKSGPTLYVRSLLADARAGESVTYVDEGGTKNSRRYTVMEDIDPKKTGVPEKYIKAQFLDRLGVARGKVDSVTYRHRVTDHGWFPLMAPHAPEDMDRLWIIRSIRREEILWQGRKHMCWRVDLIDPALPPEAEAVVAWLDESTPVFGLLKWKRLDETWVLTRSESPQ